MARMARVLLEQMDPCVRTAVELGEEAHWAGEIGLTLGWSSLTFRMFSRECANSLDHRRWCFLRQWFNLYSSSIKIYRPINQLKYMVRLLHPPKERDNKRDTLSKPKLQRAYVLSTKHKMFHMPQSHRRGL